MAVAGDMREVLIRDGMFELRGKRWNMQAGQVEEGTGDAIYKDKEKNKTKSEMFEN